MTITGTTPRERITHQGISARIIRVTAQNNQPTEIFFLMKEEPGPFYYLVIYMQTTWRCTCWQPKPYRHELLAAAIFIARHCRAAYPEIPESDLLAHIEDELRQANEHKLSRDQYCHEFGIY